MIQSCDIRYLNNIGDAHHALIERYWLFAVSDFINTPSDLKREAGISQTALNKLIKDNSCFEVVFRNCRDCKKGIIKSFSTQTSAKQFIHNFRGKCDVCRQTKKIYVSTINDVELENLKNHIRPINPIATTSSPNVDANSIHNPSTVLKFSISPRTTNKTQDNQPEYSGTFILKEDVFLKKGVQYSYGGWIKVDGNIYIRVQEKNGLSVSDERTGSNDPIKLDRIMEQIFYPNKKNKS